MNFNDQEDVFSYAYNHGVRSDSYSSWWHDYDVVKEDFHGWGMSHAYQPPPFQQGKSNLNVAIDNLAEVSSLFMVTSREIEHHAMMIERQGSLDFYQPLPLQEKSNLEITMEKLTEASNQFMASSNAFYEEHTERIESQRALDLHQFSPPQEKEINLEDVYSRLDEAMREFVAQQEVMGFPSHEESFQEILVENENLAMESCNEDRFFEVYPPISWSYGVQEQENRASSFHEVDDMKVEEEMKVSWSTGVQLEIGEESMRESSISSFAPSLPIYQEIETSLCWRVGDTNKNNQGVLHRLELRMKTWFAKMMERLEEELAVMAYRLKAPYALISPRSIVELRRQHPP